MADVFDKDAPPGERDRLFALIRETPELDWLLLTKRIGNAPRMLPADWREGYANVWLGATIVNQSEADRDLRKLRMVPARIRFISAEPLLELIRPDLRGVHWLIAGGESGPGARLVEVAWLRALRDDCADQGVAFFCKKFGVARANPIYLATSDEKCSYRGRRRVAALDPHGKGGALLDGVLHRAFPPRRTGA